VFEIFCQKRRLIEYRIITAKYSEQNYIAAKAAAGERSRNPVKKENC
jgi:hypothetical protein